MKERKRMDFLDAFCKMVRQQLEWPLTDFQTGVYFECICEPDRKMYNTPICCELPPDIEMDRFREAVQRAVAMHPAFGITVAISGGTFVMQMCREYLDAVTEERRIQDIEAAKKKFVRPFRLGMEPFYRTAVYHAKEHSYFLFDAHQMIFDWTSIKVFLDEISIFYRGEEPKQEEISIMDVAVYEKMVKDTTEYQAAREYFRNRLAGVKTGEGLTADYRKEASGVKSGVVRTVLSDAFFCMTAEQFAKKEGISVPVLFFGAFAYALGRYEGRNRSLFCMVDNGRHTPRMTESVGMFARVLPMYQEWEETDTVGGYLGEFQENYDKAMRYGLISFRELAGDCGIFLNIRFSYEEGKGGLSLHGKQYPAQFLSTGEAQADIFITVVKVQAGYEITMDYRKDTYKEETVKGLLRMLVQTLKGMPACEMLCQIPPVSGEDYTAQLNVRG